MTQSTLDLTRNPSPATSHQPPTTDHQPPTTSHQSPATSHQPPTTISQPLVVIDYQAGNLYNIGHALKYLGHDYLFSGDPQVVARAGKVILPGVGSARPAMCSLREQGLVEVLKNLSAPFLGICLGLQLLYERSEEDNTCCLGVLPGAVQSFDRRQVKVPHIGWSRVSMAPNCGGDSPGGGLFRGIPDGSSFYFVHSYYAPCVEESTVASTKHGVRFASAVKKGNFRAVQFHPERSGKVGLKLLENFLSLE